MTNRSPPKYPGLPPIELIFQKVAQNTSRFSKEELDAFDDHERWVETVHWKVPRGKQFALDNSHRAKEFFAFRERYLEGRTFAGAFLNNSGFSECRLKNASFHGAHLKDLTFAHCDLARCDFSDAYMENVQFWSCYNVPDSIYRVSHAHRPKLIDGRFHVRFE